MARQQATSVSGPHLPAHVEEELIGGVVFAVPGAEVHCVWRPFARRPHLLRRARRLHGRRRLLVLVLVGGGRGGGDDLLEGGEDRLHF